jgi:hypothetical protein
MHSVHSSCAQAIENNCGVWSADGVDGPHVCEDVVPNTSSLNMKNILPRNWEVVRK